MQRAVMSTAAHGDASKHTAAAGLVLRTRHNEKCIAAYYTIFIEGSRNSSPLKRYLYTSLRFFFGMSMIAGVGVFPRRLKANSTPGEQVLTCKICTWLIRGL